MGTGLGASQSWEKYEYFTQEGIASPLAAHSESCCVQHVSKLVLKSAAVDPLCIHSWACCEQVSILPVNCVVWKLCQNNETSSARGGEILHTAKYEELSNHREAPVKW